MKTDPSWVPETIFYQIFPDTFARDAMATRSGLRLQPWDAAPDGQSYKGGNFAGIIRSLDYLEDLGINGIYFNPIFASTANHRYHTTDYFRVDPLLGDNDDFLRFLEEAHRRSMRVVLDGVFNHCGRGFLPFADVLENGKKSPYYDWFFFNEKWEAKGRVADPYPVQVQPNTVDSFEAFGYTAWWHLPMLPKLNVANRAVQEFIFDVARFWLRMGIDGWRLDVPGEIRVEGFWEEFRQVVRAVRDDAYIVGEIWKLDRSWLQGDRFDALMNYPLGLATLSWFLEGGSLDLLKKSSYKKPIPFASSAEFCTEVERVHEFYPGNIAYQQMNNLTSHDTARLRTLAGDDLEKVKNALAFFLVCPGAPCLYYGEEIGMSGGNDPECRRGFPWDRGAWNMDVFTHVKALIGLRRRNRALTHGTFRLLHNAGNTVAVVREDAGSIVVVFINRSREEEMIGVPASVCQGSIEVVMGRPVFGKGRVTVPAGTSVVVRQN